MPPGPVGERSGHQQERDRHPVRNERGAPAGGGPVRDAVAADHEDWLTFLTGEIGKAQELGALTGRDAAALAFEIDAIVGAANTARQLGDHERVSIARRILEDPLR
ncbi:hypothetical protein AB0M34_00555 [Nocardia sp. NPDC050193]